MEQYTPKACYLTASGTQSLFLAARLLKLTAQDEVILPSFTHVATGAAFATLGVRLVFVDIDPNTLTLALPAVKQAITSRTRAIVAMHYGGIASDMTQLRAIADQNNCALIEDNAHGLLAKQEGRLLGSFGDLVCCSFERQKNVQCGQGGALLVRNQQYVAAAAQLYHSGTNQLDFQQGRCKAYHWVVPSPKYALSELLAAYLYAGLQAAAAITSIRKQLWTRYYQLLSPQITDLGIQLPPMGHAHNGHIFYLIMPTYDQREALRLHLLAQGIETRFHYTPLHHSPQGQQYRFAGKDIYTSYSAKGLLRLPLHAELTEKEVDRVCEVISAFVTS